MVMTASTTRNSPLTDSGQVNRERLEQMNLVVLVGSTAVGKTGVAVRLAKALGCHVLNCDSRQIYRGMDIGTAAPDEEDGWGGAPFRAHA